MARSARCRRLGRELAGGLASGGLAALAVAVALPTPARAHTETSAFIQPERRDESGRVTVEAAAVHVIVCDGEGENGGEFYIYQYIYRDGFRAIDPPEWGRAIGDRDFDTYAEAVQAACDSQIDRPEIEPVAPEPVAPEPIAPEPVAPAPAPAPGEPAP